MIFNDLGYSNYFEKFRKKSGFDISNIGRVIAEHKERYVVKTTKAEVSAEIIGNLRFTASSRSDFPAVGDWVAISEYEEGKALIHAVFPRVTIIERQAVGKYGEKQIIAANIDYALIVQAADRDFNVNRLERYLTICNTSGIEPLILISKIDLINATLLESIVNQIQEREKNVSIVAISNKTRAGYDEVKTLFKKGKTYCLLGSSGVGKSTLLNNMMDKRVMKTGSISLSTKKGKHITSHRELMVLENGAILIDNPGMREVGITDANSGLEVTFDTILRKAKKCKFKDCTHIQEKGCAVKKAVEKGEINKTSYENYLRMEREKAYFEMSVAEKRKKSKEMGKMIKNYKKDKKWLDE